MNEILIPKAIKIKDTLVDAVVVLEMLPALNEEGRRPIPTRLDSLGNFGSTPDDWEIVCATAKIISYKSARSDIDYGRPRDLSYELFVGRDIYASDHDDIGPICLSDKNSEPYNKLIKLALLSLQENIDFELSEIEKLTNLSVS